jgi:O-methyltransferase
LNIDGNVSLFKEKPNGEYPSFLKWSERRIYKRLFTPKFTFDDGLRLYNSVIANGRSFLRARLEYLRNRTPKPNTTATDTKAAVVAPTAFPAGLSNDEKIQAKRLLDGKSNLAQGLKLYSSLAARNISFPLEWEEKVLELCLADDPERVDLFGRYRQVLLTLGKPVPAEIERRYSESVREEEHNFDHQKAASQYHEKTGVNDTEPEFRALAERIRAFSMTSYERMYALYKAVDFIECAEIPGAIVECGVWRGGSMMLVAHRLLALGRSDRDLYLFDTYEGLPRPDEAKDIDVWGNRAIDGWLPRQTSEESSHWAEASLEDVRANILSTGYPEERLHFVKGMVERTIPEGAPDAIALLRLDTDWYASTKHEMEHLFPRLVRNGILIIDDYGHFEGARQAVDEYISANNLPLLLNRVDYSGRLAIKTS